MAALLKVLSVLFLEAIDILGEGRALSDDLSARGVVVSATAQMIVVHPVEQDVCNQEVGDRQLLARDPSGAGLLQLLVEAVCQFRDLIEVVLLGLVGVRPLEVRLVQVQEFAAEVNYLFDSPGLEVVDRVISIDLAKKVEASNRLVVNLTIDLNAWNLAVGEVTSSLASSESGEVNLFINPVCFGVC